MSDIVLVRPDAVEVVRGSHRADIRPFLAAKVAETLEMSTKNPR
jgi:hypothetical protein